MTERELAVVVPAYNEEACIERVARDWLTALDALGIDYELHVYDDGSTDATAKRLGELARGRPTLCVHTRENAGHGPTILAGYRENAGFPWIFQVDADDEMAPDAFAELWGQRDDFDLLVGERVRHDQPRVRAWVSAVSRAVVWLCFGRRVRDVNAPYRLMRSEAFRRIFEAIPEDTFAPNLLVSGWASALGLRVYRTPVPQRPRTTGQVSIRRGRLLRAALRSLAQTVRARFVARPVR